MPHGYNEMRGKSQRAPERKLLPFRCSACLWDLSDLCHEAAHFLRSLLLHLPCDVGVGSQGESRVVVPEHTADGFDVHPVLECQGRERMPLCCCHRPGKAEAGRTGPPKQPTGDCSLGYGSECANLGADRSADRKGVCIPRQPH